MKRLILMIVLAVLAGCNTISIPGFGSATDSIVPVPIDDARLLFDIPAFTDRAPVRAKYTDEWQREEYARFQSPGSQAEMVYIAATARETSLEYEIGLKSMVEKWNHNAGKDPLWGKEGKSFAAFGTVFIQPFAHSGNGCFGFSSEWAVAIDDSELNPTKAIFGYYCEASKTPLTTERINELVGAIEVSRFASGNTPGTPPKTSVAARGGTTGNPSYPFLFARGYRSEGRSFVDRAY